jgi:hypothetical protein
MSRNDECRISTTTHYTGNTNGERKDLDRIHRINKMSRQNSVYPVQLPHPRDPRAELWEQRDRRKSRDG